MSHSAGRNTAGQRKEAASMSVARYHQRALARARELLNLFETEDLWTPSSDADLLKGAQSKIEGLFAALELACGKTAAERVTALDKLQAGALKNFFERSSSQFVKVRWNADAVAAVPQHRAHG